MLFAKAFAKAITAIIHIPRGACCTGEVHRLSHRNAILDDLGVVGNEERCDNARENIIL